MKTEDEYNGWPNYETWNVNLWVLNDNYAYNEYRAKVLQGVAWTAQNTEEFVTSLWPLGTPDFDSVSQYDRVKWDHLAEIWNHYDEE